MNDLLPLSDGLGTRFARHLTAINDDITLQQADVLWQDIARRYGEPRRAYHTLAHIKQLFEQFDHIQHYLYEPPIIALALFYHDVIYDPTRADNELKSAQYAVDTLSQYISAAQCQEVYALIMMTANHQIDRVIDGVKYNDAAYLLDMDLSILGAPWAVYQQYARSVRQEYAHVSDDNYRDGRTTVLQTLLTHPKLYLTDYYYKRLESQARDNIKREINSLLRSQFYK